MRERLSKLLADRKPTRRGIHGTGNCFESADYYVRQVPELQACGFDWFKLLVSGDSGVNTVRKMRDAGYTGIFIIRPYDTSCPANVIDARFVKWYLDADAVLIESPFNEFYSSYENVWHRALPVPSIPDWATQIANGWAQFANIVLQAGGVPTTPAVEGWRCNDIFVPLLTVLVDRYPSLLRESIVSMHNRPLNHPIDYGQDTGGWLAWTYMDEWIQEMLGHPLPMIATESGPEPGWDMDKTFPRITAQSHAQMVKDILAWPTPDYYLADCFWLWEGSGAWAGASWKRNREYASGGDLPVVQMLRDWQPEPPAEDLDDAEMRALAERHGQELRIFPDGALYKRAQEEVLGYPTTNEWVEAGRIWQRYEDPAAMLKSVVSCRDKTFDDVKIVIWPMQ
jgi:hypothetical protein